MNNNFNHTERESNYNLIANESPIPFNVLSYKQESVELYYIGNMRNIQLSSDIEWCPVISGVILRTTYECLKNRGCTLYINYFKRD